MLFDLGIAFGALDHILGMSRFRVRIDLETGLKQALGADIKRTMGQVCE